MNSIAPLEPSPAVPPLPPHIMTEWADLPPWLLAVDDTIRWVALATSAVIVVLWLSRGRPDSLRGVPPRRSRITDQSVVLTMLVFWLAVCTLTVGAEAFDWLQDENAWTGIIVGTGAQIAGGLACLHVASNAFHGGVPRFLLGCGGAMPHLRRPFLVLLLALGLCPLVLEGTIRLVLLMAPEHDFATHSTLVALRQQAHPGWLAAALWCSAVAVAPVAEECFFRGILQTFLVRRFHHRGRAIILSAVLFGAVHFSVPHTIPALLLLGVLIGYLYERTGSLAAPILVHALFNLKTLIWDHIATASGGGL